MLIEEQISGLYASALTDGMPFADTNRLGTRLPLVEKEFVCTMDVVSTYLSCLHELNTEAS